MIRKSFPVLTAIAVTTIFTPALKAQDKKDPAPAAAEKPADAEKPAATEKPAAPIKLKDPVATVNGEKITVAQLNKALTSLLARRGGKIEDLTEEQKAEAYPFVLNQLIAETVVSQAAAKVDVPQSDIDAAISEAKASFPSEDDFNNMLAAQGETKETLPAAIKKMLQQNKFLEEKVKGKDEVTDADVKKFYETNAQMFEHPEMVKASHILIAVDKDASDATAKEKLAAAQKVETRVKSGEDFATIAKEVSEDPSAKQNGGDLGFFDKEQMVPEFSEAAFKMKVGDISQPVKSDFGWHIIKVTEKKEAGKFPLDEVKENLTIQLKQQKQGELVQAAVKELRDSAKIDSTLPLSKEQ